MVRTLYHTMGMIRALVTIFVAHRDACPARMGMS